MSKSAYAKKLEDPRWQKLRLEVLSRDRFTCRNCKATDQTLHVHHGYYARETEPWEYEHETLVTLCKSCHEIEEMKRTMLYRMIAKHDGAVEIFLGYLVACDGEPKDINLYSHYFAIGVALSLSCTTDELISAAEKGALDGPGSLGVISKKKLIKMGAFWWDRHEIEMRGEIPS